MGDRFKILSIVQWIVIGILLILFVYAQHQTSTPVTVPDSTTLPLVSVRISQGVLKPQSLLILNFKPLREDILNYLQANNLNASIYILNLRDAASLSIRSNDQVEPASLNKLPIAIEIMRKVERGELRLDMPIPIKSEYLDDKSGTLYEQHPDSLTVDQLMHYMLSESDNTASYALLDQIDLEDLRDLSIYLDYYARPINVAEPENNSLTVSPQSISHLFTSLYLSTILEPKDSEYILSLLTNTSFDIRKFAQLPANVTVAQKYASYHHGDINYFHSCGIMYIEDARIFYCVMTSGLDRENASVAVGDIVHKTYEYTLTTRNNLEHSP